MVSVIPIEYEGFLNESIWPNSRKLTGTTTPDQTGHGFNGNEGIHHTP